VSAIPAACHLSPLQYTILQLLSDGNFHSGERMAQLSGVSRSAVWTALQSLRRLGVDVCAVSGRGYRLKQPLELLDEGFIRSVLSEANRSRIEQIHILHSVDSTNACLMRSAGASGISACVAEHQTAGRGRRGRDWFSPFGSNLYLSLRWDFDEGMGRLPGLSLAVAVAVVRTLHMVGIADARLKWPNDVYWHGRKLGGILLEVAGESAGPCQVVVGVGLNVRMPNGAVQEIEQPWVDLATIMPGLSRNRLCGLLLQHLVDAVLSFQHTGFASFEQEWHEADLLFGQDVILLLPDEQIHGVGRGIAHDGALLLEVAGEVRRYTYGEISVRLRDAAT